jgi:hypothetical protein
MDTPFYFVRRSITLQSPTIVSRTRAHSKSLPLKRQQLRPFPALETTLRHKGGIQSRLSLKTASFDSFSNRFIDLRPPMLHLLHRGKL